MSLSTTDGQLWSYFVCPTTIAVHCNGNWLIVASTLNSKRFYSKHSSSLITSDTLIIVYIQLLNLKHDEVSARHASESHTGASFRLDTTRRPSVTSISASSSSCLSCPRLFLKLIICYYYAGYLHVCFSALSRLVAETYIEAAGHSHRP